MLLVMEREREERGDEALPVFVLIFILVTVEPPFSSLFGTIHLIK